MTTQTPTDGLRHGLSLSGIPDPNDIVAYAVAAEEAGWDGVFHVDHLIDYTAADPDKHQSINDPWITWAAVASRTERIKLWSSITPIPRRQPWQVARDLATLDRLSNGRVVLGAGLGAPWDFETFGQAYDQRELARKYDEALEVITGLWRGEPFSYDGEHYTVNEAVLRPTPVQKPRIPIVIGGWWPFKGPFRRGANWDGIIPNWPSLHHRPAYDADEIPEHMRAVIPDEPSHEEEVREMISYYHGLTDDPGEIVLFATSPTLPVNFEEISRELRATWMVHSRVSPDQDVTANLAEVRAGPPA